MVSTLFLQAVVLVAVLMIAAATVLAWFHRPKPGATPFAMTLLAGTWWAATSAVGLYTTDKALRLFWSKVEWAGIAFIPIAWITFAFVYAGRERFARPRNVVLLSVVPSVTVILALTNGIGHSAVYTSVTYETTSGLSLLERSFGPWFWFHTAYSYLLLAAGTTIVLSVLATRRALHVGQVLALVLVIGAPWIANVTYVTRLLPESVGWFDPTPYAFAISGWAAVAALQQFRFLDAVPITDQKAAQSVVDNLEAGVVVTDLDDKVSDINPVACEVLDCRRRSAIGTVVTEFLPVELPADFPSGEATHIVTVQQAIKEQYYELTVTPLQDDYGKTTGHILLMQEVTERRHRIQRLDVLNRVLRHNLRNEMNVIYGYAERLQQGGDQFALADDIKAKASELVELGDKAREMDTIRKAGDGTPDPIDMVEIANIECQRLGEKYPEVTVEFETAVDSLYCDDISGTALRQICENAAEHNESDDPRVTITVERNRERAVIEVADNGPGIDEQEQVVVDSQTESQLRHSSGLGLWLANWAAKSAGGSITISERSAAGTRVRITLPLVEPAEPIESDTATSQATEEAEVVHESTVDKAAEATNGGDTSPDEDLSQSPNDPSLDVGENPPDE